MDKNKVFALIASGQLVLSGCTSNPTTFSEHKVGNGNVVTLSYPAEKRASTILYRPSSDERIVKLITDKLAEIGELTGKEKNYKQTVDRIMKEIEHINIATSTPVIIAEPPAQASRDVSLVLEGSLDKLEIGNLNYGNTTNKLYDVAKENLVIRDALYRLNEAFFINEAIGSEEYKELFRDILTTARALGEASGQNKVDQKQTQLPDSNDKATAATDLDGKITD